MPKLIIIRGVPGAGKSTLARTKYKDYINVESNMYFITVEGKYYYNRDNITKAHDWCYSKTCELLSAGLNVVVSNTFTRLWEFEKYVALPYETEVIVATGNYKNVHGCPQDKVDRMKERFEEYNV